MSDVQASLQFILILELLGLSVLPLTHYIFPQLIDKGFGLSKIVGILITSWIVWLISSFHLAPFSRTISFASLGVVIVLVWGFALYKKHIPTFTKKELLVIAIEELLLWGVFCMWTYIRGFSPDINGLEKFMDYGFMLSILRTQYFPPLDHYLALETINYYYYGQYIAAFITQLANVAPSMGYHLQMSALMALASVQSFALSATLAYQYLFGKKTFLHRKSIVAGFLSFLFVVLFGNLHALIYLPLQGISYWYPNATRFIEYTIHEFPIYSFIVNDLHGHVSSIPLVFLTLSLLFVIVAAPHKKSIKPLSLTQLKANSFPQIALLTLTIGSLYATNAWDFAIYLLLTGLVLLTRNTLQTMLTNDQTSTYVLPTFRSILTSSFSLPLIVKTAFQSVSILMISIVLFLPFWQHFHPISQGIGIVPLGSHSPLWQLLILWGMQVTLSVIYLFYVNKTTRQPDNTHNLSYVNTFIILLCAVSFLLIILPEIIFIRDIYPTHFRANTMFKFYYQAWLMLGIVSGFSIVVLLTKLPNRKLTTFFYLIIVSIFLLAGSTYSLKATEQGFGGFNHERTSINGTDYLFKKYPADAKAIEWLNQNIVGQPVIAEAVGDSYTDYPRVASNTGLPTVLGWPVHEWLWRGSYMDAMQPTTKNDLASDASDSVALRIENVKLLYETDEQKFVTSIVDEYHIDYIFMGTLEREKYTVGSAVPQMFTSVYEQDGTVIYKVNN